MFITEQMCSGERYSHRKHDKLITKALHAEYCKEKKLAYVIPDGNLKVKNFIESIMADYDNFIASEGDSVAVKDLDESFFQVIKQGKEEKMKL